MRSNYTRNKREVEEEARKAAQAELMLMEHGVLGKTYQESDIRKWLLSIGIEFEKGMEE